MRKHAQQFAKYLIKQDKKTSKKKYNPFYKAKIKKEKWLYFYHKVKSNGGFENKFWSLNSKRKGEKVL